jgi:hypothetical protein
MHRPQEGERPALREGLRIRDAGHKANIEDPKLPAGRAAM